ncbi:MAG TPA: MMPL family transporter [Streptosporangiaceae bacterium]
MNRLLERLGSLAARRHWLVIIGWVIILAGLLGARNAFGGDYVNNYNVPGSQSQTGLNVLNKTYPQQGGYGGQIVFHAPKGTVAQQQAAVSQATSNVSKLPDVIKAVSPFASGNSGAVSKDGTVAYASVSWDVNPAALESGYLNKLDSAVAPARSAGLQVEYGGGAGQIDQTSDDKKSEAIGLGLALILLVMMFGAVATAAIPLISAIFSVGSGLSLVGLLAAATTFPTTAPTVATLLGLGVAVDYGLFLVARHREQVDSGMGVVQSASLAEGTSGAAIVVAGSTVVVSILGLYLADVPFVGALGLASAITVAVTMLAALTLVPAFMGALGEHVRALSARLKARKEGISQQEQARETAQRTRERHEQSGFAKWGRRVSRQPWPYGIAAVVLLVVLAIPLFSIRIGQPDNGTNPTSDSSRRAYDLLTDGFGSGINGPLTVVVSLPKQSSSANQSLLSSMQKDVSSTAGVASVSPASVNSAGTTAVFNVIPTTRPQSSATSSLVTTLRDDVLPKQHATTYVTGTVAGNVDFTDRISGRTVYLILAVIAIAFVLLTAAFRSIVIATKAAILNLLSIGAAYGVIVAVFQYGWGASLIGVHTTLPIPAYVPMLVFAIIFGLSMDYEVFLLSRVHEAWVETGDAQRSVAIGIGSTARVITTAAAIMVVVFSSFLLDTDPTVKMLALGMAVAVLIDATVVRMVLVPSVMSLLGPAAWWMPRWLEPIVPRLQLEGSAAATAGQQREQVPAGSDGAGPAAAPAGRPDASLGGSVSAPGAVTEAGDGQGGGAQTATRPGKEAGAAADGDRPAVPKPSDD